MNDLISIVVPVYNISKYVEKCLLSLIDQTYKNVEIIVIDDGSTDGSGAICDRIASQSPDKITVLHTTNGGLSAARNRGIRLAKGSFIGFVDGDDWVEPEMFEMLHNMMKKSDSDLSACSLKMDYDDGKDGLSKQGHIYLANQEELFGLLINDTNVLGYAWNKLFKTGIVRSIYFDDSLFSSEDIDFCAKYAQKCTRISYCDSQLYHYRQRIGSMTGEFAYSFRKLSVIHAYERLIDVYDQFCPSNKYVIEKFLLKQNLNVIGRVAISKHTDKELNEYLHGNVKKLWKSVIKNPNNSIIEKINIAMTMIMPATMLRIKQFIIKRKYQ